MKNATKNALRIKIGDTVKFDTDGIIVTVDYGTVVAITAGKSAVVRTAGGTKKRVPLSNIVSNAY